MIIYDSILLQQLKGKYPRSYLNKLITRQSAATVEFLSQLQIMFDKLPKCKETNEIYERLRNPERIVFWTAATELYFIDFFSNRLGFTCKIHPPINKRSTRPEFFAERDGIKVLVEVKTLFEEKSEIQSSEMLDRIVERLKELIPGTYSVHIIVQSSGLLPPNFKSSFVVRQVVTFVNKFMEGKNKESSRHFKVDNIEIEAYVIRTDGKNKPSFGWTTGESFVYSAERIQKAIKKKLNKYGRLDIPSVIVVDSQDFVKVGRESVDRALFGNEQITIPFERISGKPPLDKSKITRDKTGLLRPNIHTRLSAIIFHRFRFFDSGDKREIYIYHNPYAKHTVTSLFNGLPQFIPVKTSKNSGYMKWINLPKE